ncbi:MAG TPA: hypothetical protein PK357_01780 [Candidatus Pacearchaeota archaeon]|nr:hypothetical protein [Candidatus Pacearchaeota archaeon]
MGLFNKKNKIEEPKRILPITPRVSELPEFSELPKLPDFPPLDDEYSDEAVPKLPAFPTNTLGTKLSQNTIKEAVSGKKEVEGIFDADEFLDEEDSEIMHKPLKPIKREVEEYEKPEVRKKIIRPSYEPSYEENEKMVRSIKQSAMEEEPMVRSIRSSMVEEEHPAYEESFPLMPSIKSREITPSRRYREKSTGAKKVEPVFVRLDKFEEGMNLFDDIKAQIADMEHLIKNTKEIKQKEEEELNSWQNQLQEVKRQIERVDRDIFSKIE